VLNSKRRAIHQIMKNTQDAHLNRIKREYVLKVKCKRIFCAWRQSIDVFKRKRILRDSANLMHDNSLIERGLRALREYAQRKIYNKLIVAKLSERLQFGLKARTLVALGENIRFKKVQRE